MKLNIRRLAIGLRLPVCILATGILAVGLSAAKAQTTTSAKTGSYCPTTIPPAGASYGSSQNNTTLATQTNQPSASSANPGAVGPVSSSGLGQPVYSTSEMNAMFGLCNERELVRINFLGHSTRVHRKVKEAFLKVDRDMKAAGINYNFWRESGSGTYNCRKNVNNSSAMSPHAYGIAFDTNPSSNPNRTRVAGQDCKKTVPDAAVKIFQDNGFCWGGLFKNKCDTMHFEYCKK